MGRLQIQFLKAKSMVCCPHDPYHPATHCPIIYFLGPSTLGPYFRASKLIFFLYFFIQLNSDIASIFCYFSPCAMLYIDVKQSSNVHILWALSPVLPIILLYLTTSRDFIAASRRKDRSLDAPLNSAN